MKPIDRHYDDSCGAPALPARAPLPGGEREPEPRLGASLPRDRGDARHFTAWTASDFVPVAHVVEPQFTGAWVCDGHDETVASPAVARESE